MSESILIISQQDVYNLLRFGKTSGNKVYFIKEVDFINGEEIETDKEEIILDEIRVIEVMEDG